MESLVRDMARGLSLVGWRSSLPSRTSDQGWSQRHQGCGCVAPLQLNHSPSRQGTVQGGATAGHEAGASVQYQPWLGRGPHLSIPGNALRHFLIPFAAQAQGCRVALHQAPLVVLLAQGVLGCWGAMS